MNTRQAKKVLKGNTRKPIDRIQKAMVRLGVDGLDVIRFGPRHDHYIISHSDKLNRVVNHKALQEWFSDPVVIKNK